MPYVKVTGYIEVPDEHYSGEVGKLPLSVDGYAEVEHMSVGLLEDLTIEEDDR